MERSYSQINSYKTAVYQSIVFDEQTHASRTPSMRCSGLLQNLLARNIPPILDMCKEDKKSLVMTSEHGFSFASKDL